MIGPVLVNMQRDRNVEKNRTRAGDFERGCSGFSDGLIPRLVDK